MPEAKKGVSDLESCKGSLGTVALLGDVGWDGPILEASVRWEAWSGRTGKLVFFPSSFYA